MKSATIRKMTPCRSRCCSQRNACNLSKSVTSFFVLLLCCCMPLYTFGYNLDLPSFIRHQSDKPGTMFGFSIALHKGPPSAPGYTQNWVVIGAPKGDTSAFQQNIERAGAVYRCDIQDDNRCYMVPFDSKGNQKNDRGEQIDTKSNQWLGATVTSSMENGLVVACAPRYIFHSMTPSHLKRYEPVGTCFTSRNFTSFTELSPCRTNYWGYHRQGSCQAGFSAATSKKGDRLFIGAPGSWYWQGQAFSIDPEARYPYKPPMYQDFGAGGQTYSYDVTRPENKVYATGESSSNDDDSYLGYSMVSGDFDGDGEEDIAIGMPRGAGLLGKVVLYKWNMVNILNITGWQIGAYFGYSMCTVDVDGDSFDDLIIGAPMYSEPNNEGKYDVGRVYIMLQGKQPSVQGKFLKEATRDGYNSKGRFGLALTSLGDINLDGFGDFAVGAPYDGPDGRGAVYVFHGSPDGPLLKASQVIHAEDIIGGNYPRTFGFSLAGGVDMDGNLYPDLAVGAYVSDQVYVFRSRPVAVVDATATFISPTKLINLDDKTCTTVRDGRKVTCTDVKSCWKYNGVNLPKFLDFQVSWVLDAKKSKNPRMFFLLDEGKNIRNSTIRLERGKSLCSNETVYLIENVQDKLTPLEVEMRYQLRNNHFAYNVRRKRADLEPVIDQNREIVQRDSLNIQKNCGMDNICVPDLRLEIKTVDKYLLGSREPLTIEVLITNFGEDAFEAAFYMVMPKDLDFKKIQQSDDSRDIPITCTAPTSATNYTLKCDVGNPLPSNKLSKFKVVMIPSHKAGMAPSYDFFMEANSTNVEVRGSAFDNVIRKSIGIWVETDLSIEGTSLPDFQHYKASEFKLVENATSESDLGPHVVHIYNIRNNGPSTIEEAVVFIHYPYQTLGDDVLMYLLNQPETDGNIRCDPHINVNPLNLVLDQSLSRKSYLESIGAVIRSGSTASHIHVEQSSGRTSSSASATTIGQGTRIFTEEEKRRLKEEDNLESAGDASFVHSQRANTAASSAGLAGGRQAYTSSSSWNSSSSGGGHGPAVVVQTRNRTVSFGPDGKPFVYETSTEYVHNLDRPQYVSSHSAAYQQAGGRGAANVYRAGDRNVDAESQWQSQAKPINNENVRHNLQSTRGHVQMAAAPGVGGSGHRQSQGHGAESSGSYNNQGTTFYGSSSDAAYNRGNVDGFSDLNSRSSSMEKIAQGGHGFRTGTLDLGQLNRQNVDDELRNRALRSGAISGGGSAAQHAAQSSSGSSYGLNVDNEEPDNDDGYYYDQDETNSSGNHHESFSSSSSSSSSSKSQRGNSYDHRRTRRQAAAPDLNNIDLSSPCKTTKCATLRCVATSLGNNEGVWVAVRTRLVAKTMEKLASNVPLNVSTMAISHVTKLPYIGAPKDDIIRSHEIFYKAIPEPIPVPDVVPMWVVVLAACVGAIILLLLAFLLYKCGFFKRNRPSDNSQERQPLRNGYHGDEHL